MEGLAEHWIRWWYAAGGPAQPEWCVEPAASHQAMLLSAPISRHEYIAVSRAVQLPQPPEPHQGLMQWIGLPEPNRSLTLRLVEGVCGPWQLPAEFETGHDSWCRSLAKALRPGLWLPSDKVDARLLLGAWIGPQRWARTKLLWPMTTLGMPPQGLPSNRLDALWSAVLWRVSRGGEHAGQA